jgi:hypothetical protein
MIVWSELNSATALMYIFCFLGNFLRAGSGLNILLEEFMDCTPTNLRTKHKNYVKYKETSDIC